MKAVIICIMALVGAQGQVGAERLVEGRVLLASGQPAIGAQVRLFDLSDLRAAPIRATADEAGYFVLPLEGASAVPERFELGPNYPNPFNPSTIIPFQLSALMRVRLEVFNILGQHIATLVDGERSEGFHTARWDGTNAAGQAVAAGVYIYRLSGDGVQVTGSMVLIDGQAGVAGRGAASDRPMRMAEKSRSVGTQVYGLTVSGEGLALYVDPSFGVVAGMAPVELVVATRDSAPRMKVAAGGILGDVDNNARVNLADALLVALYSRDASVVMPNNGDISLGDVNSDSQVNLTDAYLISSRSADNGAASTDRAALIALYNATGGANWTNNANWLSDASIGQWHGVTTDANGRVTELDLWENQLSGSIPPELGNLTNLTWLNLWNNQLSGSIPSALGDLANLEILYLSDNQFERFDSARIRQPHQPGNPIPC